MLIDLLSDYARNAALRDRFAAAATDQQRGEILEEYSVKLADYQALLNLPPALRDLLPGAIVALLETIEQIEDSAQLKWPGPNLSVVTVRPNLVQAGRATHFTLRIGVSPNENYRGDRFTVDIKFTRSDSSVVVVGTVLHPISLPPDPIAEVSVECTATFAVAGDYQSDVSVYNSDRNFTALARSAASTLRVS